MDYSKSHKRKASNSLKNKRNRSVRSHIINETVERLRHKLLDLSRRNNLINFRETRRTVRIIDELPDEIFRLLVSDGRSLEFLPFDPPEELQVETDQNLAQTVLPFGLSAKPHNEAAEPNGNTCKNQKERIQNNASVINEDFELPVPTKDREAKHIDNLLQTPLLPQPLERRCKNLLRHWRTGIEEAGINYLYLAIGFLEWRENDKSDLISKAPLILVPLHIERTRLNKKTDCYNYVVSYSGEDIETNLSLTEKLDHDFDLILPELTDNTTPEEYFERVKKTIKKKKLWRVAREMVVGFFSFAKLRLYKDLSDKSWPSERQLTAHPIVQDILIGKEREGTDASPIYAEEYDIDNDPDADKIRLILDADSSQHSAIMDAVCKGKNLVVEGPPGTGKSQSIANMIAAALYEGKKVLFVSEKKAALEVVRKRLNAVGLGDFCLELHSHKTQKGQLHADIKRRLNQQYLDAKKLDHEIEDFQDGRKRLLSYYNLLSSIPGANKETVYEILGKAERSLSEIKGKLIPFSLENPLQLTHSQINASIAALEDFLKSSDDLPDVVPNVWRGFEPNVLLPGDEQHIQDQLLEIKDKTEGFLKELEEILSRCDYKITDMTLSSLRGLTDLNLDTFKGKPEKWDEKLAPKLLKKNVIDALDELTTVIVQQRSFQNEFEKIMGNREDWSLSDIQLIEHQLNRMESYGYTALTPDQLQVLHETASTTRELLCTFSKIAEPISDVLPGTPEKLLDYVKITKIYKHLLDAPPDITIYGHPENALTITRTLRDKAFQESQLIVEAFQEQSDYFIADKIPGLPEIRQMAEVIRRHDQWWKCIFSSEYRRAKQTLKGFLNDQRIFKTPHFLENLDKLASNVQRLHSYKENEDFKRFLGPLFKGIDTDWQRLNRIIDWSQQLAKILDSENRAKIILFNLPENVERFSLVDKKIRSLWKSLHKNLKILKVGAKSEDEIAKVLKRVEKVKTDLAVFLEKVPHYNQICSEDIETLGKAARVGINLEALVEKTEQDSRFQKYLGKWYQGFSTDTEALQLMAEWIIHLKKVGGLENGLCRWLLSRDTDTRLDIISSIVCDSRRYFESLDAFVEELSRKGKFMFEEWLGVPVEKCNLSDLLEKFRQSLKTANYLIAWWDYCSTRKKANDLGLSPMTRKVEKDPGSKEDAITYFHYALYQSMVQDLMRKHPDLATFRRATYDNIRNRIKKLDQSIQQKSRQRIAYRISKCSIPYGVGSGYVRDYTELSLIIHEINKKKRHIPIRQLVRRAGKALQAMKPCFMMSPQSVAQYFVPGEVTFDLLIMDEASQLRLEDALGAVARCDQVVIVGDPKQLPPTTFFERLIENEIDSEETTAAEEAESILDVCQTVFDCRRLRWHYRSEHEDLIAFSNSEFYNNNLIIFPTPFRGKTEYGVRHHFVDRATYHRGRNKVEAEFVARAVIDHFQHDHQLSLGVATFNIEQRDLIHDELERLQKRNPWVEKRIREYENTEEPLFIKNLENVQGDERDVIFISTTYGPDRQTGQVYQRFGPLNRPMGWRRLNVIITRARKRLELFTSMRSSDVRVVPGASPGIVALRKYLEYCEKGIIPAYGKVVDREPDSDFEIAVATLLNQNGYVTTYQVGVAGFFIDIGVQHPDRIGEFILGIECDGASYHSAKSIRDRDLLRQRILEKKGWRIYRIWSTDWFKNRKKEQNNLLKYLENLVDTDRAKMTPIEPEKEMGFAENIILPSGDEAINEDEALRKQLLEYRKRRIEPSLTELNESILSDQLLDEFVRRKPISRDEFLRFPYSLRNRIEPSQGRFLNEILDIVEEFVA